MPTTSPAETAVIARAGGKLGEAVEGLGGGGGVAAGKPDLHEQLECGRAIGIGCGLAVEAQADEVLRQRHLAARQRDRGQCPPGDGVGLAALEQPLCLVEPSLPHAQVRELDQR